MTQQFAILSLARSGTSYLVDVLNKHPDILCHGEIYHNDREKHIRYPLIKELGLESLKKMRSKPIQYINHVYQYDFGKAAIGLKIWVTDFSATEKACNYILNTNKIKKVVLERSNVLSRFSSLKIAQKTKVFYLSSKNTNDKSDYKAEKIEFKREDFLSFLDSHQKAYDNYKAKLRASNQDYLFLDYKKDICCGDFKNLLNFIGVDAETELNLLSFSVKMNTNKIIDRFVESDRQSVINCLEEIGYPEWIEE